MTGLELSRARLFTALTLFGVLALAGCDHEVRQQGKVGFITVLLDEDDFVALHPAEVWRHKDCCSNTLYVQVIAESLKDFKRVQITCSTMNNGVVIDERTSDIYNMANGKREYVTTDMPWSEIPKPDQVKCFVSYEEQ